VTLTRNQYGHYVSTIPFFENFEHKLQQKVVVHGYFEIIYDIKMLNDDFNSLFLYLRG